MLTLAKDRSSQDPIWNEPCAGMYAPLLVLCFRFYVPVCPCVHAYAHVKLGGPIAYLAHEVVSVTGAKRWGRGDEGPRENLPAERRNDGLTCC